MACPARCCIVFVCFLILLKLFFCLKLFVPLFFFLSLLAWRISWSFAGENSFGDRSCSRLDIPTTRSAHAAVGCFQMDHICHLCDLWWVSQLWILFLYSWFCGNCVILLLHSWFCHNCWIKLFCISGFATIVWYFSAVSGFSYKQDWGGFLSILIWHCCWLCRADA